MTKKSNPEKELQHEIAKFYADPLGFVRFVYPWGKPGTRLADEAGPDNWQKDLLSEIGRQVKGQLDGSVQAIQMAVASGHGIGKTALVAWIIHWFISTRPHPQIVVTANTKQQLETKTWRELAKWLGLAINGHWFDHSATKLSYLAQAKTWFAAAIPWNKDRSEAFAGTHEDHVLFIYDEASMVHDVIWEVTEGAMTTPGAMWFAFGNPTRNTGRFYQCFNKFRHRWTQFKIDSRTAKKALKEKIRQWINDYGEDSDFVRVRVKGEFPRAGSLQLIASGLVESARGRQLDSSQYRHAPKILGVDVARFGDDQSVILKRQGLACVGLAKHRGLDTVALAGLVAREIDKWRPDAVFIDEVGVGAGVVDQLKNMGHRIIPVNAGREANDKAKYHNLRAEMWVKVRDWLKAGGAIPDDQELCDDLAGLEYQYDISERYQLEKKQDMKARGLASPDCADALSMTFAYPVAKSLDHTRPEFTISENDPRLKQAMEFTMGAY